MKKCTYRHNILEDGSSTNDYVQCYAWQHCYEGVTLQKWYRENLNME